MAVSQVFIFQVTKCVFIVRSEAMRRPETTMKFCCYVLKYREAAKSRDHTVGFDKTHVRFAVLTHARRLHPRGQ